MEIYQLFLNGVLHKKIQTRQNSFNFNMWHKLDRYDYLLIVFILKIHFLIFTK